MASFNWVRDEDLEEGNPHKVGAAGWEHWVVKCANGRERWMSINMDGLAQALRGFVLRAADVAAPVGSGDAVFGDAEFGGWWSDFKKGVSKIARLAWENKDKLAKLLPEGQEAAERLIAKYRGGDKQAASEILKIATEAKRGNKDSAALLDALRAEEMQQATASLPVILRQSPDKGNLVQSVVSGAKCWMSNAEFGAAAKRVKARKATAKELLAMQARKLKARKQMPASPTANSPLRQIPSTAANAARRPINTAALRPGITTPSPLGYPVVPPYYQAPAGQAPQMIFMPGGGGSDDGGYEDDGGSADNMPEDADVEANADEDTLREMYPADYNGEVDEDAGDVPDENMAPDEDMTNAAGGSYDLMQEEVENVGSPDVAGEVDADFDPMDSGDNLAERGAVDTSILDAPQDNVGDPELRGEIEEDSDPLNDDLMAQAADESRDPMDTSFTNQGDPEMAGQYGATPAEVKALRLKLENDRLKKQAQMKAAGESKAKIAQAMKEMKNNARRQLEAVQQGSKQMIASMRRNIKDAAARRAMQDKYEDKLADLENQLHDRDMADDKRRALEAQAAKFRAEIENLKSSPAIAAAQAAQAALEAQQDAQQEENDDGTDAVENDGGELRTGL